MELCIDRGSGQDSGVVLPTKSKILLTKVSGRDYGSY